MLQPQDLIWPIWKIYVDVIKVTKLITHSGREKGEIAHFR